MLDLRVKPVTLLKKAVAPISMISIEATINYYPEGISLQATDENVSVLAILRIDASSLDYFRCNVDGEGGIDPKTLYLVLDSHDDEEEEWSVTINGNDHDTTIGFVFQNATEGVSQNYQMKFLNEIPPCAGFDELNYECQAVVGIPSAEFRRIMMHLKLFGMLVKVCITDTRVKLSTMNEEIVLRKENGECTIDGAVDEPIKFSFGLQKLASFLNASVLTSTVSILAPVSSDKPCILDCPIESLGKIMFYFMC